MTSHKHVTRQFGIPIDTRRTRRRGPDRRRERVWHLFSDCSTDVEGGVGGSSRVYLPRQLEQPAMAVVTTTKDEFRTVAVGLTRFQTVHGSQYHLMMAAATLIAIPMLIVFFLLQRHFIRGIVLSDFKG